MDKLILVHDGRDPLPSMFKRLSRSLQGLARVEQYFGVDGISERLTRWEPGTLKRLEIVAHSTPYYCGPINYENYEPVARAISRSLSDSGCLYLVGCSTGVLAEGDCIARRISERVNYPVMGALGYLNACSALEKGVRCAPRDVWGFGFYETRIYPGSGWYFGDRAFRPFQNGHPSPLPQTEQPVVINIEDKDISKEQRRALVTVINQTIVGKTNVPEWLPACPALVCSCGPNSGVRKPSVYETLLDGELLRETETELIWKLVGTREQLKIIRTIWRSSWRSTTNGIVSRL